MSSVTTLRRKLPFPSKVMIIIAIIVAVWSFQPWPENQDEWANALGLAALFSGFALLRLLFDWGYRVWYDDSRIYVRGDRLGWMIGRPTIGSIAFADIEHVEGAFGRDQVVQRRFMPFEYIRLEGATDAEEGFVMIAPNFLKVEDVRSLLMLIEQRRPGVMSEDVTGFAHSNAAW